MNKPTLHILLVGILLFILNLPASNAQKQGQDKVDSMLVSLTSHTKEDTTKVNLLNDLAWEFQSIDPMAGIDYALQGKKIAEKLNFKKGIAKSFLGIGVCCYVKSDIEKALENFNKALKISEKINDKSTVATIYLNIGNIYFSKSDFAQTLKYYNKAYKTLEEINDKGRCASVYGNIGNLYYVQGEYPKSLEYQFKSLQLAEKSNNLKVQGNALVGIGNIYSRLPDYPKALEYYFKSLKIYEKTGNKKGSASTYGNIGVIYFRQLYYSKALENYIISLKISESIGDKRATASTYTNLGNVYTNQHDYKKALECHLKSLDQFKQIKQKFGMSSALNSIARVYSHLNDFNQSLLYYKSAYELSIEIGAKSSFLYALKGMGELYMRMVTDSSSISVPESKSKKFINEKEYLNNSIKYNKMAIVIGKELGELDPMIEAYLNIARASQFTKDWKNAFLYSDSSNILQDSVFNLENQRKISDIEASRTKEINAKEIEIITLRIKHQRIAIASISIGFILMLLIALLIYRSLMLKKRYNKLLESEVAARTAELREANIKLLKAKEELEVLDQAKNEFLQIIHHEIRTPLNGILGPVDILKTSDSPELTTRMVEILDISVRRLEVFSLKTLDISELRTKNEGLLRKTVIDLKKLATTVSSSYFSDLKKKNLEVEVISISNDFLVSVDESYFKKCLHNIIDNAIRHSPANGKICIELSKSNNMVNCTIKDQGTGFTEKLLQSPIIPFNVLIHLDANAGLGLYLCSLILNAHNGNINLGNNSDGGAFVELTFPDSV